MHIQGLAVDHNPPSLDVAFRQIPDDRAEVLLDGILPNRLVCDVRFCQETRKPNNSHPYLAVCDVPLMYRRAQQEGSDVQP